MVVRVLAFARIRELLGFAEQPMAVRQGASARELWYGLLVKIPQLETLADSTRIAVNGKISELDTTLSEGDEVAFLPPVGGG